MFFDEVASRDALSRAVANGWIRRLAPRLYTADLLNDPAGIVAGNRWRILGRVLPGAVVADRSAAERGSTGEGVPLVVAEGTARSRVYRRARERTPMSKHY